MGNLGNRTGCWITFFGVLIGVLLAINVSAVASSEKGEGVEGADDALPISALRGRQVTLSLIPRFNRTFYPRSERELHIPIPGGARQLRVTAGDPHAVSDRWGYYTDTSRNHCNIDLVASDENREISAIQVLRLREAEGGVSDLDSRLHSIYFGIDDHPTIRGVFCHFWGKRGEMTAERTLRDLRLVFDSFNTL